MMKIAPLRTMLLCAACLCFQSQAAFAEENYICERLQQEETYGASSDHKFLIQGKNGYVYRSEKDFREDFSLTPETVGLFKALDSALKSRGIEMISILPPTRGIVAYNNLPESHPRLKPFNIDKAKASYSEFIATLNKSGVTALNYDDVITGDIPFFYKRDHHWTTEGAQLSARKTAALIKDLPAYKQMKKQEFVTTKGVEQSLHGSINNYIRKQCKNDAPFEKSPNYTTRPVREASSAHDLFGASETAAIALVGTSNCVDGASSYANFSGFLEQELSTAVDNFSVGGAGIDTPLLTWLSSDAYRNSPPKVMIWEIATHYRYNGSLVHNVLRQAIPAAYGACKKTARASSQVDIKGERESLFKDLGDKNLMADEYYIHLSFSKPVKDDFAINMTHVSGKSTSFAFKRADKADPATDYYYLPPAKDKTPLRALTLKAADDMQGVSVDATLCPMPKARKKLFGL